MSGRGKTAAPRIHVCTAATEIFVHGTRGIGHRLTTGAQVDFDQIVGDDADGPVTLERALGPYAQCFQPVTPSGHFQDTPVRLHGASAVLSTENDEE